MIGTATPRLAGLFTAKTIGNCCRTICSTRRQRFIHENDEKAGYPRISDHKVEKLNTWNSMKQGYKFLIEELKMFKEEVKERFQMDPVHYIERGEVDVTWKFDGDPRILEQFVVTTDSDYGEGNSTASLHLSPRGRGVFSGNLDPRVLKDGRIKRSGYCNVKTVKQRKSFQRDIHLEWGSYTHLRMRVRGDGRNYLLVLGVPGDYDILWNDSYQYVLHTRGGPYWQDVRIPFSKFFLACKGRVQDEQQPVPNHLISYIAITASDKIPGNFKLEIDYIGTEYDPVNEEEFAYEMYKTPTKFHI